MDPQLDIYFESVLESLFGVSAFAEFYEDPVIERFGETIGKLEVGIRYQDLGRLHLILTVDYQDNFPR